MTCPKCNKPREPAADDCPWCGIVFAKWEQRAQRPVVPLPTAAPPPAAAKARGPWVAVAVIGVVLAMALSFHWMSVRDRMPEEPTSETAASQPPPEPEPKPKPKPSPPSKEVADPLEIFDPILAEMNSISASDGITFTRADVKFAYDEGRRFIHPARLPQLEDELGLPSRTIEEFSEADKKAMKAHKGTAQYKCLIRDKWVYSGSLPDNADEVSECWHRLRGNTVSGPVMFINNPLDKWELYQWRPNFKSWGRFSEADSLAGWEFLIDKKLGYEAQSRDEERAEKAIERALKQESESVKHSHLRMAYVAAFRSRLIEAAALGRLEELRR